MTQFIDIHSTVLSILLTGGSSIDYDEAFSKLKAEMFSGKLFDIYKLLQECYQKHGFVDIVSINYTPDLEDTIIKIADSYGTALNLSHYIDQIVEKHRTQKVLAILRNGEGLDFQDCNNFVTDKIAALEKHLNPTTFQEYIHEGEKLREATIEEIMNTTRFTDYSTGFIELDEMLYLSQGDLFVVGGRPSMGKTAFLLSMAINYAKSGKKIAIFSLEMSAISLMMRIYSSLSGVKLAKIINPKLRKELSSLELQRLKIAADIPFLKNIIIYDEPGCNLDNLKFHIKQFVRKEHVDIICVDYLQYVNNEKQFQRNDLKIADTTREIKNILRRNNILGIILAQLNRKPEERTDKRPNMGDLDGSSEIEKTSDAILLLYRDSYYNKYSPDRNKIELILVKQRNGAVGTTKLNFQGDIQRIT